MAGDDVTINNLAINDLALNVSGTARSFSFERTSSAWKFFSSQPYVSYQVGSFSTSSGASLLTLTNDSSGSVPFKDLAFSITGNLNVNSTINLGDNTQGKTTAKSAIQNFVVGGTTSLNAGGTINFSRVNGDPLGPGPGTVNLGSLEINGGTLNLSTGASGGIGTDDSIENQLGVTRIDGATGTIQAGKDSTTANLTVSGSLNGSYGGVIKDSASSSVVRLTKAGTNTQTLTGVNTYTGSTTITGGTLILSGSGSINSTSRISVSGASSTFRNDSTSGLTRNVTVSSGGMFRYNSSTAYSGTLTLTNGKLGGTNWTGNLGGLTIGTNQIIAPGNSVGTANTTSQTWGSAGAYDFELQNATGSAGTTGWDLLTLDTTLTLSSSAGNPFVINLISLDGSGAFGDALNFSSSSDYAWLIADAGNAITGFSANLFSVNAAGFANANSGSFAVALGDTVSGGDNTQLYLVYSSVPEPDSLSMIVAAALGFLALGRRRKTPTGE